MGNWNINIQGVGCHHNENHAADAQRMAARFVEFLQAAGHTIEHADFTSGGKEDLLLKDGYWTKRVVTRVESGPDGAGYLVS